MTEEEQVKTFADIIEGLDPQSNQPVMSYNHPLRNKVQAELAKRKSKWRLLNRAERRAQKRQKNAK